MEKKLFKIDNETYLELSKEELIEKFTPFVMKTARKWTNFAIKKYYKHVFAFDYEDFLQIGYMAIDKSYRNYDMNNDCVVFTMIYNNVNYDMHNYIRDIPKIRSQSCEEEYKYKTVYLDNAIFCDSNDTHYDDLIKDENAEFEEEILNNLLLKKYLSILNEEELDILKMYYIDQCTQLDIAEKYNASQVTVGRRIKSIITKIRRRFPKDFENIKVNSKKVKYVKKRNSTIRRKQYTLSQKQEIIEFFKNNVDIGLNLNQSINLYSQSKGIPANTIYSILKKDIDIYNTLKLEYDKNTL